MKASVTYGEILPILKVYIKYIEKVLKPIGQRENGIDSKSWA